MWNIVVTEIQDAHKLDPTSAPPDAFFVSTERFARTVDYLDLSKLVSLIDRMQSSRDRVCKKKLKNLRTQGLLQPGDAPAEKWLMVES
jgi:hypothetical protein